LPALPERWGAEAERVSPVEAGQICKGSPADGTEACPAVTAGANGKSVNTELKQRSTPELQQAAT